MTEMSSSRVGVHPFLHTILKLIHPDGKDLFGVVIKFLDSRELVADLFRELAVISITISWVIFLRVRVTVRALGPRPACPSATSATATGMVL